ncbi:MAG: hypothetical protein HGA90_01985, partial [Alphaproteobacteria bacterium]|nr:hypothetical protein [Alphaproteobacteria bacterium]
MDRFELSLHFAAALVALTLLGGAPSSVHAEGHGEAAAEGGAAKESGGESE